MPRDRKVSREHKEFKESLDPQALKEKLAHQDLRAPAVHLAQMAHQDRQVHKDLRDLKVQQDLLVQMAQSGRRDRVVRRDRVGQRGLQDRPMQFMVQLILPLLFKVLSEWLKLLQISEPLNLGKVT